MSDPQESGNVRQVGDLMGIVGKLRPLQGKCRNPVEDGKRTVDIPIATFRHRPIRLGRPRPSSGSTHACGLQ